MRAKSVVKNLSDYLDDDIEEANRLEVIDQRHPLFWNESNQCIIETPKIHVAVVELTK